MGPAALRSEGKGKGRHWDAPAHLNDVELGQQVAVG